MDLFDAVKHLLPNGGILETLPPNRWDPVSFTPDRALPGKKIGKVTGHGVGFKGDVAWSFWTFKRDDDGTVHTVWGTVDIARKEHVSIAEGEHDINSLGVEKVNGRIVIKPIVQLFIFNTSVELLYDEGGKTVVYRFDGRSFP